MVRGGRVLARKEAVGVERVFEEAAMRACCAEGEGAAGGGEGEESDRDDSSPSGASALGEGEGERESGSAMRGPLENANACLVGDSSSASCVIEGRANGGGGLESSLTGGADSLPLSAAGLLG